MWSNGMRCAVVLGFDFDAESLWIGSKGEASPTYPQLERMADTFKLPIAVFFFPDSPPAEDLGDRGSRRSR